MPARARIHGHRLVSGWDRGRDALLRAPRRGARGVAGARDEPEGWAGVAVVVQRGRVLLVGRLGRPDQLPAQPQAPARSKSTAARSSTSPSTASGETTSPGSAAPRRSPASTRRAMRSSGRIGDGNDRSWSSPARDRLGRARVGADGVTSRGADAGAGRDARGPVRSRVLREPRGREVRRGRPAEQQRAVRPVLDRYLDAEVAEAAFVALRSRWTEVLDQMQVSTPNEHVDRMVNTWNAYQCMVTFNLSRSASYFESGIGRGMGFRDCCQDLLGFVQMAPDRARERILDVAGTQLDAAAHTTSTRRSRSGATTRSARASTTTRCGSCLRSRRT